MRTGSRNIFGEIFNNLYMRNVLLIMSSERATTTVILIVIIVIWFLCDLFVFLCLQASFFQIPMLYVILMYL